MKRQGGLMSRIVCPDNLRLAWYKAQKGKTRSAESQLFVLELDRNLARLAKELTDGSWQPGLFRQFTIIDPKIRLIHAAPFADRVVHHAIITVLDPLLDARQIPDSYACRRGKGTHAAVLRAFAQGQRQVWFAKLDVRKFFDSVDHAILKGLLRRIIKDRQVLDLLDRIIDSYHTVLGKGLPIGNLTSQYFANHYLAGLDHEVKSVWRISAYLRYMDDMVVWGLDCSGMRETVARITDWLADQRQLVLKPAVIGRSVQGLPFLGYRLTPQGIYLAAKSKRRFRRKIRRLDFELRHGRINETAASERAQALVAMTLLAHSRAFRQTVCNGASLGHEPRHTRRELEQRHGQPAGGQSQQQHS